MIWEALQPFVDWLGGTPFAQWLGQSTARIAWLLTFHLFGLTILLGSVVVSSLRLLGLIQRRRPIAQAGRDLTRAILIGLIVMMGTGFVIFAGGAADYYAGYWFRLKMQLLAVAVIFHFTLFRTVMRAEEGRFHPAVNKVTGALALTIWFGVGWAGRAIAFF